jgi:hypothetical protein
MRQNIKGFRPEDKETLHQQQAREERRVNSISKLDSLMKGNDSLRMMRSMKF